MKYLILLSILVLASCASTPKMLPQIPQQGLPKTKKYFLDTEKIESLKEVIEILKIILPPEPILNIVEDSVRDQKKVEALKHLFKDETVKQ